MMRQIRLFLCSIVASLSFSPELWLINSNIQYNPSGEKPLNFKLWTLNYFIQWK